MPRRGGALTSSERVEAGEDDALPLPSRDARAVGASVGVVAGAGRAAGRCLQPVRSCLCHMLRGRCGASCAYHVCPRAGVPLKLSGACDRGAVSRVEGAT